MNKKARISTPIRSCVNLNICFLLPREDSVFVYMREAGPLAGFVVFPPQRTLVLSRHSLRLSSTSISLI